MGILQYFALHDDPLGSHTAFFIEANSRLIECPYIQLHIEASRLTGKGQSMVIQCLPDPLSSAVLVHTQVINVQDLPIGKNTVTTELLVHTEDIAQNVFIKYMQEKKEFQDFEHKKAWLFRTTINECKMHLRYYWNSKRTEFPDELESVSQDDSWDTTLLDLVMALPRKYREVIHLFYYEELSIKEISGIIGKKESTIKTNLRRGKQLLKVRLEEIRYER